MSIRLNESLFKYTYPCIHSIEENHQIRCKLYGHGCIYCDSDSCNRFQPIKPEDMIIVEIPSIPHWKKIIEETSQYTLTYYQCSNCNHKPLKNDYDSIELSRYCPNCGEYLFSEDEVITHLPLGLYKHYKGNMYQVIEIAENTEDNTLLVIYRSTKDLNKVWARPLSMFIEFVEDVNLQYRGPRFYKI